MHLEIDRVSDDELGEIQEQLTKVLTDVRDAVEDWERMHTQIDRIVEDLEENPPPLPEEEVEQGKALLRWLARQPLHLPRLPRVRPRGAGDGDETLVAVPGTGFGILRADPPAPRVLPEAVASRARDKHLLVLAKANSKATVHRPVLPRLRRREEVRRATARSSASAASSGCSPRPPTPSPYAGSRCCARRRPQVIETVGLDPMSHAGKALMDVLETYPRDELFQTPVEDLVPIASQVMYTRERRQLKLFVRRDIYGRFLSCLVYLPRDRYNTTVRERIAAILKEQLDGEQHRVHRARGRVVRRAAALRRTPASGRADRRARRPRPRATLRRGGPVLARRLQHAVISTYGEEQGSRLVRTYAACFPEAYKEDYPPQTGAVDLGRLEQIEGDEGLTLSLYEDVAAPAR